VATGQDAEAFLGTQGDVWDTQWDMFTALIGSIVSQIIMKNWHNRSIRELEA
jgi:putative membrane protein